MKSNLIYYLKIGISTLGRNDNFSIIFCWCFDGVAIFDEFKTLRTETIAILNNARDSGLLLLFYNHVFTKIISNYY